MQQEQSASPAQTSHGSLVAKNAFYLTVSQALTVPIAILVNAELARFLGAADFGFLYLAATISGFGFLIVNWGHENALPSLIARDRSRAGALLGSSLAWRVAFGVVVYGLVSVACMLLGYDSNFQFALGMTFLITGLAALIAACKDTIRGFERTDIPAYVHVGQQFLTALLIVPVLFLHGGIRSVLLVQIPASLLVLFLTWRTLRPVGVGGLSLSRPEFKSLMVEGTPFVFFGLATALQPNIDAVFLSKLTPSEVMGWFAVSRRLIGVLLFPASALVGALYPTLCRLHVEDKDGFARVSRGAFSSVALLSVPIALGCYLYPEIGVAMFNRTAFSAAEDNLRWLSPFLFLLYFSMPLSVCVLASGKQRAFALVQVGCVVVSVILDPILVPILQRRYGNGGLGVCAAAIASEALVVVCAMALCPRGLFEKSLLRSLLLACVSGGLMALAAHLMHPYVWPLLAAPIAVCVYLTALWFTGALDKDQVAHLKATVARKFSRASSRS